MALGSVLAFLLKESASSREMGTILGVGKSSPLKAQVKDGRTVGRRKPSKQTKDAHGRRQWLSIK